MVCCGPRRKLGYLGVKGHYSKLGRNLIMILYLYTLNNLDGIISCQSLATASSIFLVTMLGWALGVRIGMHRPPRTSTVRRLGVSSMPSLPYYLTPIGSVTYWTVHYHETTKTCMFVHGQ